MESECQKKKKQNIQPTLLSFTVLLENAVKSFIMASISNNKNYYVQIKSRELD